MSKHVLQSNKARNIIIDAIIGESGKEEYWPRPTEWPNRLKSDVLYAADNSEGLPPVLVEVQYSVDNKFLHRLVRYCEEIITAYDVPPVVMVIAIHECSRSVLKAAKTDKKKTFFFKLPCYPWAEECFILSKESICAHLQKTPLEPIVALGSFFVDQKQALVEHDHHDDPTIKQLYHIAGRIVQNQVTVEETRIDQLLRVIHEAESFSDKAISTLDDGDDDSTKKRAIGYMKQARALLKACKRQRTSSPEADQNGRNWRYIERYLEKNQGSRMKWPNCYQDGIREGYFQHFSNYTSLKNAYNRWKKGDQ
ncbi:uncharacterized protein BYT42DRAFT_552218 [Radiomyces spectabilis]|uniref:uncharacterized protein n=1 Tax=Radiomyces spectabilis TaxID=64574 RepID=UPI002220BF45|nr:uncharacterized protein BYT42DRAFT_552218 [Radiomyces spectabilis]KAI8393780.1 hypothetical protein BYT42DRAFT_552218 [Radiomyces spectabilis]